MPLFEYKALSDTGTLIVNTVEAASSSVVAEQLERLGYMPIRISEKRQSLLTNLALFKKNPKVKRDDIIIFTRQLVTLLRAGVPLLSTLEALAEQSANPGMKAVINAIHADVEGGTSFSEALSKHPRIFEELYVNSIKAGEVGGALDEVLERLAFLMEHDRETRARVKAAMRYPIIVVVSLCIAFVVLIMLVVPKFIAMFKKVGVELPLPTRILIGIHYTLQHYWWLMLGVIGVAAFAFRRWIKTERGRYHWDHFKLNAPIFGNLVLKTSMSRFTRMFETMNSSGLPILQTLDVVARTVGNAVVAKEIEKASLGIRKGEGIALPLKQSKFFPPMVIRMIAIGEQSGSLDEMLLNVSKHYDMEVDYAVKNLTSMIEPVLTVALGFVVLFLALSIFLPMWDLTKMVK